MRSNTIFNLNVIMRGIVVVATAAVWTYEDVRAQTGGPPELLTSATGVTDMGAAGDPLVIRSRAVYVDLALLNALNPRTR